MTTPNKIFCLEACGLLVANPITKVPIKLANQSQIKADWGKGNTSCPPEDYDT